MHAATQNGHACAGSCAANSNLGDVLALRRPGSVTGTLRNAGLPEE
jgi:hypothetical protein